MYPPALHRPCRESGPGPHESLAGNTARALLSQRAGPRRPAARAGRSCLGVLSRQLAHIVRHRLAGEDMDVEVEHGLAAVGAMVGDDTVAAGIQPEIARHLG